MFGEENSQFSADHNQVSTIRLVPAVLVIADRIVVVLRSRNCSGDADAICASSAPVDIS